MLLHACYAGDVGFNTVMLRTFGTNVMIGITCFGKLKLDSLRIAFGVGKYFSLFGMP
jgi:hypothetical protein